MKKLFVFLIAALLVRGAAAQIIPSFEFGLKAGANLSHFSTSGTFSASNRAGYLGGVWARVGGLGFNFQPELYITAKNVDIYDSSSNTSINAKFTSIDVPLLLGSKFGAMGVGGRLYTGPVISFAVNNNQSLGSAAGKAVHLNYKDQNVAWQFGAGVDIRKLSVDLRYEYGLSKQPYNNSNDKTRISLFNLSLGYRLFSL